MTAIDRRRHPRGVAALKLLGLLAGVLLLGLLWKLGVGPLPTNGSAADRANSPIMVASGPSASATPRPPAPASDADQSPNTMATAGSPGTIPHGRAPTGIEIAALGLTRQLTGDHLVTMDSRRQRVLGSKEVIDQAGRSDTMLVIRDEISGQLSHRRSGLQFALKPGVDPEAFIAEHRAMRRVFVNPVYAQVLIDAAEIAAHYNALGRDDRVASVRFMTRDPVVKPR